MKLVAFAVLVIATMLVMRFGLHESWFSSCMVPLMGLGAGVMAAYRSRNDGNE